MTTGSDTLRPCSAPTLFFIGVTTGQSSIMRVFPKWAEILGLDAVIAGYDAPIHAPSATYRAIVEHIRSDPLARGALVTTHKIDLLHACQDLFDRLDPLAQLCDEVSCIAKHGDRLHGFAKDPVSAGLAWQTFVPLHHWQNTGGDVLCLGAGGAATAISVFVASRLDPADRPARFIAVDRNPARLAHLQAIHRKLDTNVQFEYVHSESARENDALLAALAPGSLVINATGMGKDRPGSPLSDDAIFPQDGLVWELNYRGTLEFLHQARRQAAGKNLTIVDGWTYFLHGWTQVIAEVFDVKLTPPLFAELDKAAADIRP